MTAGIEDTRLVRDAVLGRLDAAPAGPVAGSPAVALAPGAPAQKPSGALPAAAATPYTVWGTGFGDFGRNGSNGNAAALERSVGGFVLGGDTRIDSAALLGTWRVGIAGGYTNDSLTISNRASDGSFETYFGGLYAGASYGALDVKLGLMGGGTQTNTRRTAAFPGMADTDHASYGARWCRASANWATSSAWPGASSSPCCRAP